MYCRNIHSYSYLFCVLCVVVGVFSSGNLADLCSNPLQLVDCNPGYSLHTGQFRSNCNQTACHTKNNHCEKWNSARLFIYLLCSKQVAQITHTCHRKHRQCNSVLVCVTSAFSLAFVLKGILSETFNYAACMRRVLFEKICILAKAISKYRQRRGKSKVYRQI